MLAKRQRCLLCRRGLGAGHDLEQWIKAAHHGGQLSEDSEVTLDRDLAARNQPSNGLSARHDLAQIAAALQPVFVQNGVEDEKTQGRHKQDP